MGNEENEYLVPDPNKTIINMIKEHKTSLKNSQNRKT
jgi:hypothetical protein